MTSVGDEYVPRVHDAPGRARASSPKKALVLGGGDGGAARQLLKHACIERIVVAELDDEVVGMARRYLDDVHQGALDDPRVEVRSARRAVRRVDRRAFRSRRVRPHAARLAGGRPLYARVLRAAQRS
jgi:hypothetical protein